VLLDGPDKLDGRGGSILLTRFPALVISFPGEGLFFSWPKHSGVIERLAPRLEARWPESTLFLRA